MSKEIAQTILTQLGGNRFITMTGAKYFTAVENGLQFRIPRAKGGIQFVTITVNGLDLYDVKFTKLKKSKHAPAPELVTVAHETNLYADALQAAFTEHTGLYTKLG